MNDFNDIGTVVLVRNKYIRHLIVKLVAAGAFKAADQYSPASISAPDAAPRIPVEMLGWAIRAVSMCFVAKKCSSLLCESS